MDSTDLRQWCYRQTSGVEPQNRLLHATQLHAWLMEPACRRGGTVAIHIGDGIVPDLNTRAVDITISDEGASLTVERKRRADGSSDVTVLVRNGSYEPLATFTFDHHWWAQIVNRMEQL